MSVSTVVPLRPHRPAEAQASRSDSISPLALVLLGGLISVILSWPHVQEIWRSGSFHDTDDAMRMVQVRSWLAGQGWFDLAVPRLDPSHPIVMHWSRVVDVPLALLIRGFSLVTTVPNAELLTREVFPLALQVALIAAAVMAGCALAGPRAALPAMILIVTNCFQFGQFVPGRIDHHAPQITLLMLAVGFTARAMLQGHARSALWASLCIAVSLAISLENLPFFAVIIAGLALAWAWQGEPLNGALRGFGLGLAGFAVLLFAATVGPQRYAVIATDAYSLPHLVACVLGGLMLARLASAQPRLPSPVSRLAALAAAGAVTIGLVVGFFPAVLSGPYGALDPVVKSVWLSRVTEAFPLPTVLRLHPQAMTLMVCPLLAGLGACLWAAYRERGMTRAAWMLVATTIAMGLAASFWEVRVMSSITPLATLGGVWAFMRLQNAGTGRATVIVAAGSLLLFSSLAWAMIPVPEERASVAKVTADAEACRAAANVTPLAALGTGLMLAPIDSGSHLLVHTGLSVMGAPYHRNNHGNLFVIQSFSANLPEAETMIRDAGVRYVALCPGQVQAEALTARNPNGLAAALVSDHPPAWLAPIDLPGTTYKVFAVR